MKIIHDDGTVGAISFPTGTLKKGGTCEFSTKKCRENCMMQPNEFVKNVYKFFKENEAGEIFGKIVGELYYREKKFLHWFPAGDCPSELEDKIVEVMKALSEYGITQNGFTRNKSFWYKAKDIPQMRLCFTVEDKKKAPTGGFISIPNYSKCVVNIFKFIKARKGRKKGYCYGSCGSGWVIPAILTVKAHWKELSEEDCGVCYNKKVGCFAQ